jgi:hypothetical protein
LNHDYINCRSDKGDHVIPPGKLLVFIGLALEVWLVAARADPPLITLPDPRAALRPEAAAQRDARHVRVADARSRTIVILHRGAWEFAPENTLSAVHAGFQLGAQGVELDFRRTADDVIVLFHDDRLERLLDGVGRIDQYCYEELLLHSFNSLPGAAVRTERVPAVRDVLQLVRDHAGLLHLDIKDPDIDSALLQELRDADMLDHVVTYNEYHSEAFRAAGIAKLPFYGSLMEQGRDVHPQEVQSLLRRPGKLVILDDPRATLTVLGQPPTRVVTEAPEPLGTVSPTSADALEAALRGASNTTSVRTAAVRLAIQAPDRLAEMAPELGKDSNATVRRALAWNLGMLAKHRPELISKEVRRTLLQLLNDAEPTVGAEAGVACGRAQMTDAIPVLVARLADRPSDLDQATEAPDRLAEKRILIEARARYAFALGLLNEKRPEIIEVLVDAVRHRAVHEDLGLVGVDGAMAAWALGRLRAVEAVGALRAALFRDDPTLAALVPPSSGGELPVTTPGWLDFQMRTFIVPALAEIGGDHAATALDTAVNLPDDATHPLPPDVRGRAAAALLACPGQDVHALLARFLSHSSPEVRRTAILACLRRPDRRYRGLLESAAPWAVPWWDVQHGRGLPR